MSCPLDGRADARPAEDDESLPSKGLSVDMVLCDEVAKKQARGDDQALMDEGCNAHRPRRRPAPARIRPRGSEERPRCSASRRHLDAGALRGHGGNSRPPNTNDADGDPSMMFSAVVMVVLAWLRRVARGPMPGLRGFREPRSPALGPQGARTPTLAPSPPTRPATSMSRCLRVGMRDRRRVDDHRRLRTGTSTDPCRCGRRDRVLVLGSYRGRRPSRRALSAHASTR